MAQDAEPETPTLVPPAPAELSFNGVPLSAYREAAFALLRYAVGEHGRSTSDPIYRQIVEGRLAPGYSSCADLAHWLLYRLGVRAPWINRAENKPQGWSVSVNLNRLIARPIGPCDPAVAARNLTQLPDFGAGDVYVINNRFGGHVICVQSFQPVAGADLPSARVATSEYGQPGGAQREHALTLRNGLLFSDGNQVLSMLRLPDALGAAGLAQVDAGPLKNALAATLAPKA